MRCWFVAGPVLWACLVGPSPLCRTCCQCHLVIRGTLLVAGHLGIPAKLPVRSGLFFSVVCIPGEWLPYSRPPHGCHLGARVECCSGTPLSLSLVLFLGGCSQKKFWLCTTVQLPLGWLLRWSSIAPSLPMAALVDGWPGRPSGKPRGP